MQGHCFKISSPGQSAYREMEPRLHGFASSPEAWLSGIWLSKLQGSKNLYSGAGG